MPASGTRSRLRLGRHRRRLPVELLRVGVGNEGSLQTVACGPGAVAFFGAAETTYYSLVIDDQNDGDGSGGSLSGPFVDAWQGSRRLPPPRLPRQRRAAPSDNDAF